MGRRPAAIISCTEARVELTCILYISSGPDLVSSDLPKYPTCFSVTRSRASGIIIDLLYDHGTGGWRRRSAIAKRSGTAARAIYPSDGCHSERSRETARPAAADAEQDHQRSRSGSIARAADPRSCPCRSAYNAPNRLCTGRSRGLQLSQSLPFVQRVSIQARTRDAPIFDPIREQSSYTLAATRGLSRAQSVGMCPARGWPSR